MKTYYGNQKPYVYVCSSSKDDTDFLLKQIADKDIALCLNELQFNRKEEKRIANSCGVLLFMSENLLKEERLRKVLETAVLNNKNILTVYLEEVKADPSIEMQLNAQQALFRNNFADEQELSEEMAKSVIFKDMRISDGQKKAQRQRALTMVFVSLAIAAAVFFGIVYPRIVQDHQHEEEMKEQFGLLGLSDEDLAKITSLHIVGDLTFPDNETINKVSTTRNDDGSIHYDVERIGAGNSLYWAENGETAAGEIEDISILKKMPNLKRLTIAGENISDISPIFELTNLQELVINCNPITSLEGIENCKNLERIEMRDTLVSDLSPLFTIESLNGIWINNCQNISSLAGIENTHINCLEMHNTGIRNVGHLPHSTEGGIGLSIGGYQGSWEFLADNDSYDWFYLDLSKAGFVPYLHDASARMFDYFDEDLQELEEMSGIF